MDGNLHEGRYASGGTRNARVYEEPFVPQEESEGLIMIIVAMQSYPVEQAKEMAKRFAEMPPVSSFLTKRGPYLTSVLGGGIKTITLYEFEQARTADAMTEVGARFVKYHGVPGMTYSVELWIEAAEALKSIGVA